MKKASTLLAISLGILTSTSAFASSEDYGATVTHVLQQADLQELRVVDQHAPGPFGNGCYLSLRGEKFFLNSLVFEHGSLNLVLPDGTPIGVADVDSDGRPTFINGGTATLVRAPLESWASVALRIDVEPFNDGTRYVPGAALHLSLRPL